MDRNLSGVITTSLRAMTMKGYSAFPKAPALLKPHHQIVYCNIQGFLPLCRDGASLFNSPSRLSYNLTIILPSKNNS